MGSEEVVHEGGGVDVQVVAVSLVKVFVPPVVAALVAVSVLIPILGLVALGREVQFHLVDAELEVGVEVVAEETCPMGVNDVGRNILLVSGALQGVDGGVSVVVLDVVVAVGEDELVLLVGLIGQLQVGVVLGDGNFLSALLVVGVSGDEGSRLVDASVEEEPEAVLDDGAAQGDDRLVAVLVAGLETFKNGPFGVVGLELLVVVVERGGSGVAVTTGLGDNVDHGAADTAVLGGEAAALNGDLLHDVCAEGGSLESRGRVAHVHAVQVVGVVHLGSAVGGITGAAGDHVEVGGQGPGGGQGLEVLLVHVGGLGGALFVHRGGLSGNDDRLFHGLHLHGEVEVHHLVGEELQVGAGGDGEAVELQGNRVHPWGQVGETKDSVLVGHSGELRHDDGGGFQGHCDPGKGETVGGENFPDDGSRLTGLSESERSGQEKNQEKKDGSFLHGVTS